MKRLLLAGCFLLLALPVLAQSGKLKKADEYYSKLSYAYAIELYEELIGTEADSPEMKGRLATSYYKIGNTPNAEKYFSLMINSPAATREDYFNYAQVLKQNGNYALSDQWMQKFHEDLQADMRGISFANDPSYIQTIEKLGSMFTINNLSINSQVADFGGYPSPDGKQVYFVSSRNEQIAVQHEWSWNGDNFLDLYRADISGSMQPSQPELITRRVNTRYHEGPLCFSPDGKTVYFTRNNLSKGSKRRDSDGIQNLKLYRAAIEQDGTWKNEESLPFNSQNYSVGHPAVSADGKTLYFVSDKPSGFGGADLYKVEIKPDGTYGEPLNLGSKFNTEGQEMFPWISSDGNLFFSSNGHIGLGGLDVFVVLPARDGGWGKVINVGKPVNSQKDDFAFTMNKDNRTGYFSSNREGGKGDDDIYFYELIKPFRNQITVEGKVTDQLSGLTLPGAVVQLEDERGNVVAHTVADANGNYSFDIEPDKNYILSVKQMDYFDNSTSFSTISLVPGTTTIQKDIALEKNPGLVLYALIVDGKTNLPLEGVNINILDKDNGQLLISSLTPAAGSVQKGLIDKKTGDVLSYTIQLSKSGYLGKTLEFSYRIKEPGVINISEKLDLSLDKLEVGTDLASIIDIKPIYFDYGKYVIRKDAAMELDKIVRIMNDYPTMEIELGSHTDCRGSVVSNNKLSDSRAKASAAYVKSRISNPERIYGKGYGESKLKNGCSCEGQVKSNCTEAEHQENRRTEFVIIRM